MKNVSFPKDMRGWSGEVVETTDQPIESLKTAKIDTKTINELITQCEKLILEATNAYGEYSHKELYDTIIDLNNAKKSVLKVDISEN